MQINSADQQTVKRSREGAIDDAQSPTSTKSARKFRVAYLCMEFALEEGLELYSGGLGILAGDVVKTAVDHCGSIVAIGLLWNQGFTIQTVLETGETKNTYKEVDRSKFLPVECPSFSVKVKGEDVELRAFTVEGYGSNIYFIEPVQDCHRWITQRLYQGGDDDRVAQELLLGVGAVRFVRAMGVHVDLFHFNEGHAVFAGLEIVHEKMSGEHKLDFDAAVTEAKKMCVFTTHTPVPAGNEKHPIERVLNMGMSALGFSEPQIEQIGGSPFNMTVAAFSLSCRCNAVAQLHRETAMNMWKDIASPPNIVGITNGVHVGSWQDKKVRDIVDSENGEVPEKMSDDKLWAAHCEAKKKLIDAIETQHNIKLPFNSLLIGFARRAATYKRHTLLLHHKAEAIRHQLQKEKNGETTNDVCESASDELEVKLIEAINKERLVCLFSGKAHPSDDGGKEVIKILHTLNAEFPKAIVYLENYGMRWGRLLTQGCDIWLNTPVRPMEASGTSGMKAAMNGVLNVSILDGWWPEMCKHQVNGWQIGEGADGDVDDVDTRDAALLHQVLLNEVLPTFEESEKIKWRTMMRQSIKDSSFTFSSERMVQDYWQKLWLA